AKACWENAVVYMHETEWCTCTVECCVHALPGRPAPPGLDRDRQLVVADVDEAQAQSAFLVEGEGGRRVDRRQHPAGEEGDVVEEAAEGALPGQLAVLDEVAGGIGVRFLDAHPRRAA